MHQAEILLVYMCKLVTGGSHIKHPTLPYPASSSLLSLGCRILKTTEMETLATIFLLLILSSVSRLIGADGGEWSDAHATFYGGADASGTMGKSQPERKNFFIVCSAALI